MIFFEKKCIIKSGKKLSEGVLGINSLIEKCLDSFIDRINERLVYRIVIVVCAFVHFTLIFIFAALGVGKMAAVNVISVAVYITLYFLAGSKSLTPIGLVAYTEIVAHATLAILSVGWQYGFSMFLVCIVPLVFYLPFKSSRTPFYMCFMTILQFILLKAVTTYFEPFYDISPGKGVVALIYIYNSIISFLMIVVLSVVYNVSKKRAQAALVAKNMKLEELASVDPLTKLLNRRSMFPFMNACYERAVESGTPFALILSDIDDFKEVNDRYGHDCGDMILKRVSDIFRENTTEEMKVCRWGGEEIMVLIPESSAENGAELAEKIRDRIANTQFVFGGKSVSITVTFGVSENKGGISVDKTVTNADRNMYSGKRSGKNCVVY